MRRRSGVRTGPSVWGLLACTEKMLPWDTHSEVRLRINPPYRDLRLTCLSWRLRDLPQFAEEQGGRGAVEPKEGDRRPLPRSMGLLDPSEAHPIHPTHTGDLLIVTRRVNPQDLDGDMAALVFTLPDIGIPTAVQRVIRSVVTKWDFQ
jgi:hypothetical protein